MYFEAKIFDKNYKVDVTETKTHWKIGILLEGDGQQWKFHEVLKTDFFPVESAISLLFQGSSYLLDVFGGGNEYTVFTRGSYRSVKIFNDESILQEALRGPSGFGGGDSLTAGMPGKIVKIMVKPGDQVKANQPLLIMEAMKMENEMRSMHSETIKEIHVKPGDSVDAGANLISFVR
jgi:acetyl/propionyl-CoA carboxylase alpha subunit